MNEKKHIPPSALDQLKRDLERLKLRTMLSSLDEALSVAPKTEQGYVTFLAGLASCELLTQNEAAVARRLKAAGFPQVRTFDTFDWTFQPGLNIQLVKDLMNLQFIQGARPVLLLGRPGTGKSHLSMAYGHLAALAGYSVRFFNASKLLAALYAALADHSVERFITRLSRLDLLIIDDLRELPPRPEYASLLFDLIDARYNKRAIILSSNLSVNAWGRALGNPSLTAAIVDRLMEKAHIINIKRGRSYRTDGPDAPPHLDRPDDLSSALPNDSAHL